MTAKSKYAKYHAVRIAKAIKAGEDPNASNPKQPDPPIASPSMQLDQELAGAYMPPTVESAPDSNRPSRPASIVQPLSSVLPPVGALEHDVSPIEPTSRQGSVGGGYFPSVPTFTSETTAPTMPTADPNLVTPGFGNDPSVAPLAGMQSPSNFYTQPSQPPAPQPPVQYRAPVPTPQPQFAAPLPQVQAVPPGGYRTDDDSITLAQKHAKWAQSALNFEDVSTAVKELRLALQSLGAV